MAVLVSSFVFISIFVVTFISFLKGLELLVGLVVSGLSVQFAYFHVVGIDVFHICVIYFFYAVVASSLAF